MTTSNLPDIASVFQMGRAKLEQLGWYPTSQISNEFHHGNLPNAEIRLLYSGGIVHISGWHRVGTSEVKYTDHGNTYGKVTDAVEEIHEALTQEQHG